MLNCASYKSNIAKLFTQPSKFYLVSLNAIMTKIDFFYTLSISRSIFLSKYTRVITIGILNQPHEKIAGHLGWCNG